MMKSKNYLLSVLSIVLTLLLTAFPVFADMTPELQSHSCIVVPANDVSNVDVVAVAYSNENDASAGPTETNIKIGLTPVIETAKTGTGVFNTVGLVGCNHTDHGNFLASFDEVGWRISV